MFLRKIASIRTNNFDDAECINKIQALWQEQQAQMAAAFADGESFYAVYHDYAGNYQDDYSLSLCCISDRDDADFDTSQQHYQPFAVDKNHPQGVFQAWQNIWQAEEAGTLHRAYGFDFEEYKPDQNITVFIATK